MERQVLLPKGIRPLGIAAHPTSPLEALKSAYLETIESEIVQTLIKNRELSGRVIWRLRRTVWMIVRLSGSPSQYFSLLIGYRKDGSRIVAYSAREGFFRTLLKTWEEFRNPFFFRVSQEALPTYSKTGILQGANSDPIQIKSSKAILDVSPLECFQIHRLERQNHHVAYLTRREKL